MSDNLTKFDMAEITFCLERAQEFKDVYGHGRTSVHALPWTFVRLNAEGQSRDYVMPLPPNVNILSGGIHSATNDLTFSTEVERNLFHRYGRAFIEYMPNKPFPFDSGRGQGGEHGVHFFGGI